MLLARAFDEKRALHPARYIDHDVDAIELRFDTIIEGVQGVCIGNVGAKRQYSRPERLDVRYDRAHSLLVVVASSNANAGFREGQRDPTPHEATRAADHHSNFAGEAGVSFQ